MNVTEKIIKNVFSSWVYYFVQFGVGFLMVPFMVHRLGDTLYGLWILALSFSGYGGFFDLGIRGAIVKYTAEFEAKKDTEGLLKVINTGWMIHLLSSILILFLTVILYFFVHRFFKIEPHLVNDFRLCLLFIGINFAFTLSTNVFVSVIEGFKRQDIVSAIEIISFLLQSALIVLAVSKHASLVTLGIIILSISLLKQWMRAHFVSRIFPQFKLKFSYFTKSFLNTILNYSIFLFIFQGLRNIISSLPNILLGAWLGGAAITVFSIGTRLAGYVSIFLFTTAGTLLPFISGFSSLRETEKLKKTFLQGTKYTYMLALLFGCIFLIMGKQIISLWVGPEFAHKSYPVLFIVILPIILSPSISMVNSVLQGIGNIRFLALLTFIELIAAITLSRLFFLAGFGIKGVAIGVTIPYFLSAGLILPIYIIKLLKINFLEYLKVTITHMIFPLFVFVTSLYYLRTILGNTARSLIVQITLATTLYLIVFFIVSKNQKDNFYYLFKTKKISSK
ncbi:MAG: oligosaccharide flippase family protein [Candidatus Omnitrophota bacterium]